MVTVEIGTCRHSYINKRYVQVSAVSVQVQEVSVVTGQTGIDQCGNSTDRYKSV